MMTIIGVVSIASRDLIVSLKRLLTFRRDDLRVSIIRLNRVIDNQRAPSSTVPCVARKPVTYSAADDA